MEYFRNIPSILRCYVGVERYRFGPNLDSKFYVRKNFFSHGRTWVRLWFGSYKKKKIFK